jgi:aspartate racemase
MNPIGVIGGIGPESTIDYYRLLIEVYQQRRTDGSYPAVIINSVDLGQMIRLVAANDLGSLEALILIELDRLCRAGATIGLLAANTPHIVYDALEKSSPLPLVSIVETTCSAAKRAKVKRAGLFGTRFTMQGGFYQKVFQREGIEIVIPNEPEMADLHARYMGELVKGNFTAETRERAVTVARRLQKDHGIEALILGGTELPLLLRGATGLDLPLLDTTRLHVEHVVTLALLDEDAPADQGPPIPGAPPAPRQTAPIVAPEPVGKAASGPKTDAPKSGKSKKKGR